MNPKADVKAEADEHITKRQLRMQKQTKYINPKKVQTQPGNKYRRPDNDTEEHGG